MSLTVDNTEKFYFMSLTVDNTEKSRTTTFIKCHKNRSFCSVLVKNRTPDLTKSYIRRAIQKVFSLALPVFQPILFLLDFALPVFKSFTSLSLVL